MLQFLLSFTMHRKPIQAPFEMRKLIIPINLVVGQNFKEKKSNIH